MAWFTPRPKIHFPSTGFYRSIFRSLACFTPRPKNSLPLNRPLPLDLPKLGLLPNVQPAAEPTGHDGSLAIRAHQRDSFQERGAVGVFPPLWRDVATRPGGSRDPRGILSLASVRKSNRGLLDCPRKPARTCPRGRAGTLCPKPERRRCVGPPCGDRCR